MGSGGQSTFSLMIRSLLEAGEKAARSLKSMLVWTYQFLLGESEVNT